MDLSAPCGASGATQTGLTPMEVITNALSRAMNTITTMRISDLIDVLIVAYIIYQAIRFVRRTNSFNLAKGVLLVLVALLLSYVFRLNMIYFLLRNAVELGLIVLVILFQPELRRVLERMGRSLSTRRMLSSPEIEMAIAQTVQACTDMSASRTGALIIYERDVQLGSVLTTGTIVNADVSAELLKNLFYNKAPLHDGAVIIRNSRILGAGCVLPLTQSTNLSKDLGMRHRAGIGLSEQSDAIVIIVSEETGAISVAIDGTLKRHLDGPALDQILHSQLIADEETPSWTASVRAHLKSLFKGNTNEQ